jgi:MFS family permease
VNKPHHAFELNIKTASTATLAEKLNMKQSSKVETREESTPVKKGKPLLLLLFFTVFIDLVGFGLIIPVMPTLAREYGASKTEVGLLIASYSLMQFLFTPFWGKLSDKVGRRPILLISLAASALGYIIWGFAGSLWMLIASRVVAGIGNANIAVAQAYVADVTTDETRSKGMGAIFAGFGLGFVMGPALGGLFTSKWLGSFFATHGMTAFAEHPLQVIGFVAAFFSLLDLVCTAIFLPEPEKRGSAGVDRYGQGRHFIIETIQDPRLQPSLLIFFISTFAFANMEATLVLLTMDKFGYGPQQNSLMFTYVGLLICLVQGGFIHHLYKIFGEKKLVTFGTATIGIGLLMCPFGASQIFLYVALAVLAIGSGINTPANQSMLSKLANREKMGAVLGVGQSLATLGRILGPAIGCLAYDRLGMQSPYVIGALSMVVALLFSLKVPPLQTSVQPKATA